MPNPADLVDTWIEPPAVREIETVETDKPNEQVHVVATADDFGVDFDYFKLKSKK